MKEFELSFLFRLVKRAYLWLVLGV